MRRAIADLSDVIAYLASSGGNLFQRHVAAIRF